MPGRASLCVACQSCSPSSVPRQGQVYFFTVLLDSLCKHVVKHIIKSPRETEHVRKHKMQNKTTKNKSFLQLQQEAPHHYFKSSEGFCIHVCLQPKANDAGPDCSGRTQRGTGTIRVEEQNKRSVCRSRRGVLGVRLHVFGFVLVFTFKDKCCSSLVASYFQRCQQLPAVEGPSRCKINLADVLSVNSAVRKCARLCNSHVCDVTRGPDISRWYFLS